MNRQTWIALVILALLALSMHGGATRRCRDGTVVAHSTPCDGSTAERLRRLTAQCHRIIDAIDDDRLRAKIRRRWRSGRVDELEHHHGIPAVSSLKQHLRVCASDPRATDHAIVFVLIHEMAHIGCDSVGHTPEFWRVMTTLLRAAARGGIWQPSRHDPHARVCGTPVGPVPHNY